MEIQRGQYFTPEKRGQLVAEIEGEIKSIDEALKTGDLGQAASALLRDTKKKLQDVLNGLFNKKGVITPNETDSVLDTLNESKRARLERDFILGMRRTTWYVAAFGLLAVGLYIYMKKRKK
jgi:hypothetical protein